jgi:1-deoxy-D-xylulose-5-phosphate synthase
MSTYLSKINSPRDLKGLSLEQLHVLASEIRQELIEVVTENGGHLGSNLGVVELTIALHFVFDIEHDFILWDVSNQTYTHKLLTGRREGFRTLRRYGGISGFANREESPYDHFTFGHAGTAIATALGIACGNEMSNRSSKVIAVVGDGAMTCGSSYEAINNCGTMRKNLIVILNDNSMSISPTVGSLSRYLTELRTAPLYEEVKKEVHAVLSSIPKLGLPIEHTLERVKMAIKAYLGINIFQELGFQYYGPIDGHDLRLLIRTLQGIRHQQRPVLLHVVTQKGKGHPKAEVDPVSLHGLAPNSKRPLGKPYTKVFSDTLVRLAQDDPRIVAITAAMSDGTGLTEFKERFPQRYYDVAICEQTAVALAAGLAHTGARPIVAIYSTFLQRGYDQVFQEVCLQNLPIIFAMDRAGVVGPDGPTHHGLFDISYLRVLPNIVLMAPKDKTEFEGMLEFALRLGRPCAIRYPRKDVPRWDLATSALELGKAETLFEGEEVVMVAYGSMVETAVEVRHRLLGRGIKVGVVNGRFAKPLDAGLIEGLLKRYQVILTVEEHALMGGFGSAILEVASQMGLDTGRIKTLGVPDRFIEHGERDQLLRIIGLHPDPLVTTILSILARLG